MTISDTTGTDSISGRVLVVDDEPIACDAVAAALRAAGAEVRTATDVDEAMRVLSEVRPDAVVTDVRMPMRDGFAFLDSARAIDPLVPIVLMSGYGNIEDAVAAIRAGAEHYVTKPVRAGELTRVLSAAIGRRRARQGGGASAQAEHPAISERLVGESDAMQRLRADVMLAASLTTPLLVVGEPGIGKHRIAQAIHAASNRASGPFVTIDCGADAEKHIFDEEAPSDTSSSQRLTAFDDAIGGTLFLEYVDEMPLPVQSRLVRLLQPGRGPGEGTSWQPSVRIIASSRRDLSVLRRLGAFRDDLYFRLAATEILVAPLRDRREDIPVLAEFALGRIAATRGTATPRLSPSALHVLQNYAWPGNENELESILASAVAEAQDGLITPEQIGPRLRDAIDGPSSSSVPGVTFAEMERYLILSTYEACKHNVTRTAEVLGLSPRTIHYRLREYRGLGARRRPRFGPDAESAQRRS